MVSRNDSASRSTVEEIWIRFLSDMIAMPSSVVELPFQLDHLAADLVGA